MFLRLTYDLIFLGWDAEGVPTGFADGDASCVGLAGGPYWVPAPTLGEAVDVLRRVLEAEARRLESYWYGTGNFRDFQVSKALDLDEYERGEVDDRISALVGGVS